MANQAKFNNQYTKRHARRGVTGEVKGAFIDVVLPLLLQLLPQLPCFKPAPVPTPQPSESEASADAWKEADDTKSTATSLVKKGQDPNAELVEYKKMATGKAVRELRKKQRQDGTPISKDDAENMILANLDQARLGDLETNALKIDSLHAN